MSLAKAEIRQNIQGYIVLSAEEKAAFSEIVSSSFVKKRQFIVQPGFVCKHQTFVCSGALRSYFVDGTGAEHTIQFAIEDWFISDFNSYINQTPASLFVEALEDTHVQQISFEDVEELCVKYPKFERFFRLAAQKAFAFSQKRVLANLGKNAEERFLEFSELYPEIVLRVPQYTLASYLGMSAEFLSKIRKRISLKS